ncbi:hypothetical protein JD969_09860 [Planctomycetota bacterium]|nr:hypothetical protein JD969_09860 [Planctomycetota bacterium]
MRIKKFAILSLIVSLTSPLLADTFQGLGYANQNHSNPSSTAYDISADGKNVIGISNSFACIWTAKKGWIPLGKINNKATHSLAKAISNDGKIVVGVEFVSNSERMAFAWTAKKGMQPLGAPTGRKTSNAMGIAGNGKTIVGITDTSRSQRGFIYNQHGMNELPKECYFPTAVSFDGKVIASNQYIYSNNKLFNIGSLPGGSDGTTARGISDDGSTVVGSSSTDKGGEAFIWTKQTGMKPLGSIPGTGNHSNTWSVNQDGTVVVGWAGIKEKTTAFIWTKSLGMKELKPYLMDRGLSDQLKNWRLTRATGITPNGKTIVGVGVNPKSQIEAFIVTLD